MSEQVLAGFTLLLLGGLGGFLAGLLGVGGGMVFVLIFSSYFRHLLPEEHLVPAIIANSMFAIFFAGISGTYKQYRNKNFYPSEVLYAGIPASLFSLFFTWLISRGTWYTPERFTVVFITLLLFMAYKIYSGRDNEVHGQERTSTWFLVLIGSLGGIIASFSGIGGGVIMVPFFANFMHMPIRKATSVSLGVIVVIALSTSLFNMFVNRHISLGLPWSFGLLSFIAAVPVAFGSMLLSPLGVYVSDKLNQRTIRIIFTLFILTVISRMLYTYIIS